MSVSISNVILFREERMVAFDMECKPHSDYKAYKEHVRKKVFWNNERESWMTEDRTNSINLTGYFIDVQEQGPDHEQLFLPEQVPLVTAPPTPDYYNKSVQGVLIDFYRIAQLYDIGNGPRYHMVKKLLRGGSKDGKSELELIEEQRGLLNRWEQMINEDLQFASENEPSIQGDK